MRTRRFGAKYTMVIPTGILDGGPETKALETELAEQINRTTKCVIVNLAEVPHLTMQGLHVLIDAHVAAERANKKLVAMGVDVRIQSIFVIQKLEALFRTLYSSVQEIINADEESIRTAPPARSKMRQRKVGSIVILQPGRFWFRSWNRLVTEREVYVFGQEILQIFAGTRNDLVVDLSRVGHVGVRCLRHLIEAQMNFAANGRYLKLCGLTRKFELHEVRLRRQFYEAFPYTYRNEEQAIVSFADVRSH